MLTNPRYQLPVGMTGMMRPADKSYPTVGLAMIMKNETVQVEELLKSLPVMDQIVVVRTDADAMSLVAPPPHAVDLWNFAWVDDFAAARNYAFSKMHTDWIIWLDADDNIDGETWKHLPALLDRVPEHVDAIFAPYKLPGLSYLRERIIRRAANLRWEGAIHECIQTTEGRYQVWEHLHVLHQPTPAPADTRNLDILKQIVANGDTTARTYYYLANEYREHGEYEQARTWYRSYLIHDGTPTWERYDANIRVGWTYHTQGNRPGARAYYREALNLDPTRADAWVELAILHAEANEYDKALPYLHAVKGCTRPRFGFIIEAYYDQNYLQELLTKTLDKLDR